MKDVRELLELTARIAADYLESVETRRIFPTLTAGQLRDALGGPLPNQPLDPREVVAGLAAAADGAWWRWAAVATSAS